MNPRLFSCLVLLLGVRIAVLSQVVIVAPSSSKHGAPWSMGQGIAKYDNKTNSFDKIYESKELSFHESNLKVSPTGKLIAGIGTVVGNRLDAQGASFDRFALVVIDANGRLVSKIDGVALFDWSPRNDRLVYATGIRYSDKDAPSTNHLWSLDLEINRKVDLGKSSALAISWVAFDGSVYAKEPQGVFKIDANSGKRDKTNYRDIHFSQDGKYYFAPSLDPKYFRVFERATNRNITPNSIRDLPSTTFAHWAPNGRSLIIGDGTFDKKILDVESGMTISSFTGKIIGYDRNTLEIITRKDKRVFRELQETRVEKLKSDN
jgi:WD40 repeat protein